MQKPRNLIDGLDVGIDAIWKVIRKNSSRFTSKDILNELKPEQATASGVRNYIERLLKGGYIVRTSPNKRPLGKQYVYKLINDVGIEAPCLKPNGDLYPTSAWENMWRSMRIIGEFNCTALAAASSTNTICIKPQQATKYISHLHRAGYLKLVKPQRPNQPATYQLIKHKYTGSKPPTLRKFNAVYDPNLKKIVWRDL